MASTLGDLQGLVVKGLGGRNDSTALTVINACLNYAITLAALLFEPPELREQGNLIVSNGNAYVSVASLTDLLDIQTVYNSTGSNKMWYIPWESWYVILPAAIGSVKYFSIFGDRFYVKDTPSADTTFLVSYSTYPGKLVNSTDPVGFDYHDSYLVSVALGICWAFFEEGESAGVLQKVADAAAMPLALGAKARQVIEGKRISLEALLSQLGKGEGQ